MRRAPPPTCRPLGAEHEEYESSRLTLGGHAAWLLERWQVACGPPTTAQRLLL